MTSTPSTITPAQEAAIRDYVNTHIIARGIGTEESACSIAAINLALSGELTDDIPECMSNVIGRWVMPVQDLMPDDLRNREEWRGLLPLAAGTGRDPAREAKRLAIIMDWMWGKALPIHQPLADAGGYGRMWRYMCKARTVKAARVTEWEVGRLGGSQAAYYAAAWAADALERGNTGLAAADARARAAASAARAAAYATFAALDAEYTASRAKYAEGAAGIGERVAAYVAASSVRVARTDAGWERVNPTGLLRQLIEA